jgi:hypothetical protein
MHFTYDFENEVLTEIPKDFYDFDTNNPISNCISCNKYLLENGTRYMVEKAFQRYPKFKTIDTIFEYALCMQCMNNKKDSISKSSARNIENYFMKYADNFVNNLNLIAQKDENTESSDLLAHCIIKGTDISTVTEYQICGLFNGKQMVLNIFPYAISGLVAEEINELLSVETKEEIDDFIDEHFGFPPEIKKLIKEKDLVIL